MLASDSITINESAAQEDEVELIESVHSWSHRFQNFSTLPHGLGDSVSSPKFTIGHHTLKIRIYPGGMQKRPDSKGYVGVYLGLCGPADPVEITYKLSITLLHQLKSFPSDKYTNTFDGSKRYGCCQLVSRYDLLNTMMELSIDEIEVVCEIYGLDTPESAQKLQIFGNLEYFLGRQEFSDVTIILNGKKIYAHKIILSNGSSVFADKLKNDIEGKMVSVIEIEDIEYNVIIELLRFIYSGNIGSLENITEKLLIAADKYTVSSLKTLCEKHLCYTLNVENVTERILLANCYGAKLLKKESLFLFRSQRAQIIKLPGFGETVKKMDANLIPELFEYS